MNEKKSVFFVKESAWRGVAWRGVQGRPSKFPVHTQARERVLGVDLRSGDCCS